MKPKGGGIHLRTKGFTIIELMVVVLIVGLLATIVLISVNYSRAKGRDARRMADIDSLYTAFQMFANDNKRFPTTGTDLQQESRALPDYFVFGDCLGFSGEDMVRYTRFSSGQNAIPLAPYIAHLPQDPRDNYPFCYWYNEEYSSMGSNHHILMFSLEDLTQNPDFIYEGSYPTVPESSVLYHRYIRLLD